MLTKSLLICLALGCATAIAMAFLVINPPNCAEWNPAVCPQFGQQQGGFPLIVLHDNAGESPTQSWGHIDIDDIGSTNLAALAVNTLFFTVLFWIGGVTAWKLMRRRA